jgi:hypothetical protein
MRGITLTLYFVIFLFFIKNIFLHYERDNSLLPSCKDIEIYL